MKKYLPHATVAIQVLVVLIADKYFGLTDMAVAKLRGG